MKILKGINNIIPCKNDNPVPRRQIPRERRIFTCSNCKYQSNRRYNLKRHQERIHWNRKLRVCCGVQFYTKGDYYVHCELSHPETRLYAILSRSKYKIINNPLTIDHNTFGKHISNSCKWKLEQQFSEKIRFADQKLTKLKSQLSWEYMFNFDIEDIPLICFFTDRRLRSYLKRLPCSKLKNKINDKSKKQRSVKIVSKMSELTNKVHQTRYRSYLEKLPRPQLIKNDNKSTKQKQNIEIAISSKQSVEKELCEDARGNCQMKVSNSTESSITLKLPTKKLLLHRFRADVVQKCEIPLREQNNNCKEQMNFGKENRSKNWKRFEGVNKENVSKLSFGLKEQLKDRLDRDMELVAAQSHRDFLNAIDFEKYKIF